MASAALIEHQIRYRRAIRQHGDDYVCTLHQQWEYPLRSPHQLVMLRFSNSIGSKQIIRIRFE